MISIQNAALIITVLVVSTIIESVQAEYYLCNVCQNSDEGDRYLADPSQSFVNPGTGDTWTCGFLQEAMQDVDPTSSGAAGEAYLCSVYQIYAEQYCTCNGPDVPSLLDGKYKDINPSCNLCSGHSLNYVPYFREGQTVDTGIYGTHNCIGLYEAAMYGNLFDADSCESVAETFEACCSMPDLPDNSGGGNGSDNGGSGGGDGSSGSRTLLPSRSSVWHGLSIIVLIGISLPYV
jgi:hypothetical protein